jgi:hypothetical protein
MSNDTERKFWLEYRMEVKRHPEQVSAPTDGGTLADSIVVIALQPEPDGALTCGVDSIDKDGVPVDANTLFLVWLTLADRIAKTQAADEGQRKLCAMTLETVHAAATPPETKPEDLQ